MHSIHAAHTHTVWDLRIHEVVDVPNWVVGCFIPDWLFEERT